MSLVILPGVYRPAVVRHLGQLVPAEVWMIDQFGFVDLVADVPPSLARPGVLELTQVIKAPGLVEVSGGEAALTFTVDGGAKRMSDVGGSTFIDPNNMGPNARVSIVYDSSDNYGNGYWVRGEGGTEIDCPPHIILGHELAHALYALSNTTYDEGASEAFAITVENELRAGDTPVLPRRASHEGGPKAPPKEAPSNTTKSKRGCFVATAAYGSPLHPAVESLRVFRELSLRRTRHGRAFFEQFFLSYERASAPVIAAMNADPQVRDVVRDWLVSPIVRYLELARDFPDLPIEEAGKWAPFLRGMRDDLEEFASTVPLPAKFGEVDPAAAVDELCVALRFQLRSPERRQSWLRSLIAAGELPLSVKDDGARHELRARLKQLGVNEVDAQSILGSNTGACSHVVIAAFGNDVGTIADTVSWRYTVTFRNADPDGAVYLNLRVYYLAHPGESDNMGIVTLGDLSPGEIAVFPLCECSRLFSYYIEGDLVLPDGTTGSFVFPDEGSMTARRAGDPNPCEDSWAF
jgi:hypothetical protein